MATLINSIGFPLPHFVDNNGDALSGGKLYVYAAGTTTPKATYPTSANALAATSANPNPVIMNSRGEPYNSGNIGVYFSGTCKMVLKDSTDTTTYWTLDNIGITEGADTQVYLDINGNNILTLTAVGSAVNYLTITNNATGANPTLVPAGGDAAVGIDFKTLTTGTFNFKGNASTAAILQVYEQSTNGTNYVAVKAPSSIASNYDFVLPPVAPTSGQYLTADGSLNLQFSSLDISSFLASQSDQETGTSTTKFVSPGRQHYHQSAAKAWAVTTWSAGTPTIDTSYNIASISDDGTGLFTYTYTTAFSSANYAVFGQVMVNTGGAAGSITQWETAPSTTTSGQICTQGSSNSTSTDPATKHWFVAFGDQ